MIPDSVTVIVKAPNQQIEDQNVECQSSWSVRQLKGHLSEVYPTKPKTDEQKIIYSGQLLEDNIILKDVLRTYDSQFTHTMHLVCTPKKMNGTPLVTPETPNTDGLRQRNVPSQNVERPEIPRPETRQNDQNHSVEMQNYLSSFVNNYGRVPPYPNYIGEGYLPVSNDPAMLANHMMMMQQAYLQYMQQYANMWQAPTAAPGAVPPAEAPAPAAPEAPPVPAEDEDGAGPPDWLDHLYAASRLAILFSLVYLYGSPARLLLVLLLVGAGYLHQIGFFRDLHVNGQNNARRNDQNANQNNANQNNANANNANQNNANQNANQNVRQEPTAPRPEGTTTTTVNDNENQQSLLAVTWMIFTSFFASLIPDTN